VLCQIPQHDEALLQALFGAEDLSEMQAEDL
jgi:hypothetical protein